MLDRSYIRPAILATGLALGGMFVGDGFRRGRTTDRFVTVRGVSEREVKADLALWPLRLAAANNELSLAQSQIAKQTADVFAFLRRAGIDSAQIQIQTLQVTDLAAERYGTDRPNRARYIINQTLMVRSPNVDVVDRASQRVGELVAAGVALSSGESEYSRSGPMYLFTKLTQLKPVMIAEATADARAVAEQFARDSRSAIGGIRHATQGLFSILPRDDVGRGSDEGQLFKIVRVVTSMEYYLK